MFHQESKDGRKAAPKTGLRFQEVHQNGFPGEFCNDSFEVLKSKKHSGKRDQKTYFLKTININNAYIETIAQEFHRLLDFNNLHPKTRIAELEDKNGDLHKGIISEAIPDFCSLGKLYNDAWNKRQSIRRQLIIEGNPKAREKLSLPTEYEQKIKDYEKLIASGQSGFGGMIARSIWLNEIDLRNANICVHKNKFIKIDSDKSLPTISGQYGDVIIEKDYSFAKGSKQPRLIITKELIEYFPRVNKDYEPINWIGQVYFSSESEKDEGEIHKRNEILPFHAENYLTPALQNEYFSEILKIMLLPDNVIHDLVYYHTLNNEVAEKITQKLITNKKQYNDAALSTPKFQEFLGAKQAETTANQLISQLNKFILSKKAPLIIDPKKQLKELFDSADEFGIVLPSMGQTISSYFQRRERFFGISDWFASKESLCLARLLNDFFLKPGTPKEVKNNAKELTNSLELDEDIQLEISRKIDYQTQLTNFERFLLTAAYMKKYPDRAFSQKLKESLGISSITLLQEAKLSKNLSVDSM